jgi:hypothetical protein
MGEKAGLTFMGVAMLCAGAGIAWLFYAHPEGFHEGWTIWVAWIVPALFVLAGLHLLGTALNYPGIAMMTLRIIPIALLLLINWAVFFTPNVQCVETISFLGFTVLQRYPSNEECRLGVMIIVGTIDAAIVIPTLVYALRKWRKQQT